MRWERVQSQHFGDISSGPGKRWGHTCNSIKDGRFLYVFGGYGEDNCQTNQVHVFDTATQAWSQPVIKGTPPTPRDSHSCTAIGDNLFVFGGTDGMNPLKDLHILDTSSNAWISPTLRGEGPEAREGHSSAVVGKRLYIFGGCGKYLINHEEVYYNDLYILNTETFVWKRATTFGIPPSPRGSHTCSSWRNKVIVIGGEDKHDYYLSDVHILDTDTLTWREQSTSGQLLTPRAGHATVAFGKNLFVLGGFTDAQNLYNDLYILDIDTGVWSKVATIGDGPSARFSVAGDCLDPTRRGVLVFIGGCNKSLEALDDMYYLYTGLSLENEQRIEKLSLRKQLKLKCQGKNLSSFHDQALVRVGIGTNMCQTVTLPVYGQVGGQNFHLNQSQSLQGKKTFHAKVTEQILDGYTIETIIDGKPLRGVLFSNKTSYGLSPIPSSNRKRTAAEAGILSNGDYNSKTKAFNSTKADAVDPEKTINNDDNESGSCELKTESSLTPLTKDEAPSLASEHHKVTENSEPSATHLNLGRECTNNAPKSNSEVPEEGKKFNIPIVSCTDDNRTVSVATNTVAASSLNQDNRMLASEKNEAAAAAASSIS